MSRLCRFDPDGERAELESLLRLFGERCVDAGDPLSPKARTRAGQLLLRPGPAGHRPPRPRGLDQRAGRSPIPAAHRTRASRRPPPRTTVLERAVELNSTPSATA